MAEDTCVLLVAGGIGGDFSILHNIAGEGWIVEYNTVLAVQAFLYGVQRFFTMPSSSPMPAMVHQPCDSMKICPSSFTEWDELAEMVYREQPLQFINRAMIQIFVSWKNWAFTSFLR